MKNQITLLFFSCFLLTSSCELFHHNDPLICTLDAAFCNPLLQDDKNKVGIPVDAFLGSLPSNLSEQEIIDQLLEWIICKSCVASIDFSCVSCLYSMPPQSRIGFSITKIGQTQSLALDVLMSEQPRFVRVFELP